MKSRFFLPALFGLGLSFCDISTIDEAPRPQHEQIHTQNPLEQALSASGVKEENITSHLLKFDIVQDEFLRYADGQDYQVMGQEARAEMLKDWFEGRMDKKYDAEALDVDEALDAFLGKGKWNCVSGNILAYLLAETIDLEMDIVEKPGHVYLALGNKPYDITSLIHRRNTEATVIDFKQLVANIPYSKGTQLMKEGNYETATSFFRKAEGISPKHRKARTNLAHSLRELNRNKEALTIFDELKATSDHN